MNERGRDNSVASEETALDALRRRGVTFQVAPLIEGARDLPAFAEKSGLRPRQVIKSLLLDVNGERYALLLAAGDRVADFAALRRQFGVRSVRLADPETVRAITGYQIGTVTPLALRTPDLPVLIDDALITEPLVSLGIGIPGRHVRFAGHDLPAAVEGMVGAFAKD